MEEPKTLFELWTKERNITVEEMWANIAARIEQGMNNLDPEKRASWEQIPCAGEIPTPEEWLRFAVEWLDREGRGDLLHWHKILGAKFYI